MKSKLLLATGVAALLILLNGKSSPPADVAEKTHTRYDAGLGWVNIPGLDIPNLYGDGLSFKTNAQGFRNDRNFDKEVPAGKRRVLCSGDSFTLGYGVGQQSTWCAQLEKLDSRLETVNLGQGGYGIDQCYLAFLRETPRLDFQDHLFTFIFTDFERMKYTDFFGYQKPLLKIEGGRLVASEAGPPDPDFHLPKITAFRIWLHGFAPVQWLESLARKYLLRIETPEMKQILSKLFENLKAENKRKGSRLTAVYLPTPFDREETLIDELRDYLREELARQGILFLDFTPRFRQLKQEEFDALFLSGKNIRFAGAAGHYSDEGNRFVAELLHEALFSNEVPD